MVWIHLVPKVYDGIDDPELEVWGRRDYIRLGVDASEELIEKLLENGDCHIINKNLITLKKGFKKKMKFEKDLFTSGLITEAGENNAN